MSKYRIKPALRTEWRNQNGQNIAARSFHQLRRFCHLINVDKVFGTHSCLLEQLSSNFNDISVRSFVLNGAPEGRVPSEPGLWRGPMAKAKSNRARSSNATASLRPIAEWRRSNRQTAHIRHHALTRFTVLGSSWFVMDLTQGSTREGRERSGMSKVEIQS
jgi:hypothetical protein